MEKGFYLFAPIEEGCVENSSEIERKIRSQCKSFGEDISCKLTILDPVVYSGSVKERVIRRLPNTPAWRL